MLRLKKGEQKFAFPLCLVYTMPIVVAIDRHGTLRLKGCREIA